jgi:four helix bundle protein
MPTEFHSKLKSKIDVMVHEAYALSRLFPKDELHGAVSQLRRASLSIALNYIEGFARRSRAVNKNFADIAYGSLQESKYIVKFALAEGWVTEKDTTSLYANLEELGRMFWGILLRSAKSEVKRVA